jgi:hypothetical protein
MQEFLDSLIAQGTFGPLSRDLVYLGGMIVFGAIVLLVFILNVAGASTFIERRVWARIQSRVGPNRVGPQGILQWVVDGIKLIMKTSFPKRRTGACSSWRRTSSTWASSPPSSSCRSAARWSSPT